MSTVLSKSSTAKGSSIFPINLRNMFRGRRASQGTKSVQLMTWHEEYSENDITGAGDIIQFSDPKQMKRSMDEMFLRIKDLFNQVLNKSGMDTTSFEKLVEWNRKNNRLYNRSFFTIADTLRKIQHMGALYEWDIKGMPQVTSFDKCIELMISPTLLVCRATVYRYLSLIENFYVLRRRFGLEPVVFGFDLYLIQELTRAQKLSHRLQQSSLFYERLKSIQAPEAAQSLINDIKEMKKLDAGERSTKKTVAKSKQEIIPNKAYDRKLPDTIHTASIMRGIRQNQYVAVMSVQSDEDREIKIRAYQSVRKQYLDERIEPDLDKIREDILEWIDVPFYENQPHNNPIFSFQSAMVFLKGCSIGMARTTLFRGVVCFIVSQKANEHIWKEAGYKSAAAFCRSVMDINSNFYHLSKIGRNLFHYFRDIRKYYRAESIGAAYNLQYLDKAVVQAGNVKSALEKMVRMPHAHFKAYAQGKTLDLSPEEQDSQLQKAEKLIRLAEKKEIKSGHSPLILCFLNRGEADDFNFYVEQSYQQWKVSNS